MTRLTLRILGTLAVATLVATTGYAALRAQQPTPQPDEQVPPALLQEVQLLRESIQQAVLLNSRMELSLRRLGHEQEVVSEYAGVQGQLGDVTDRMVELARQLSSMQEARRNATNREMRDDLEGAVGELTAQLDAEETRQQRLRAEETEALQRLRAAEARAQTLEGRLEDLESVLASPRRR